jgi:uncharacterized protein (DUF736 family)
VAVRPPPPEAEPMIVDAGNRSAMSIARALVALVLCASPLAAAAQQILIDQGARVEGLWVFPSAVNPLHYYYVPSTARLVADANGDPAFSFLRYVINRASKSEADASKGITQAEGGGILHFLITYDTPEEQVRRAERALQRLVAQKQSDVKAEDVKLRGPIIFKAGRYVLISSIINPKGDSEPQLLATGNAPVLEGSQLALSFELTPERATLLNESLKMATPDISLIFEMTIEGLTDSFAADMEIHWDDVYKHEAYGVKAQIPAWYFNVGGNGSVMFDQLMQSKAVEVHTRGANPNMEALLEKVQMKLLELMFEPIPLEGVEKPDEIGQLAHAIKSLRDDEKKKEKPSGGITFSYKMQEARRTGNTKVSLNSQSPVERMTTIGFNVGDLWARYGKDTRLFKTVNLADPAFEQREIHVGIDGAILPEFEAYINSVTTVLRKQHQDGKMTVQEIVVDRDTFKKTKNDFRMIYGWSGDEDRTKWLQYEYRTRWSFKGGGQHETEWKTAEANMIDLYAPYKRRVLRIFGDSKTLTDAGVRAVVVKVDYPFFESRKTDKLTVRADQPITDKGIELTMPLDATEYHWDVTWIGVGGKRTAQGTDKTFVLFVDELPPAEAAEPPSPAAAAAPGTVQ